MEQVDKAWRKSSYTSSGGNANCVELGQDPRVILVRDTKNREGHTLRVNPDDWQRFTGEVKAGILSLLCVTPEPPGSPGRRGGFAFCARSVTLGGRQSCPRSDVGTG